MKMYGDWMQKDEKVETINQEIAKILARMNETFAMALEVCTYKDKRW
jgi:hypothetical protein